MRFLTPPLKMPRKGGGGHWKKILVKATVILNYAIKKVVFFDL